MNAEELIDRYLEVVGPVGGRGPRKRTLAQKQGARQGGRTRTRRQSTEEFGAIYDYYFSRRDNDAATPR